MDLKNEFKQNDIKNHGCYYCDYIMRVIDINSGDILLDEKNYRNNLVFDNSYKTVMT